jgi:hypothetical protein
MYYEPKSRDVQNSSLRNLAEQAARLHRNRGGENECQKKVECRVFQWFHHRRRRGWIALRVLGGVCVGLGPTDSRKSSCGRDSAWQTSGKESTLAKGMIANGPRSSFRLCLVLVRTGHGRFCIPFLQRGRANRSVFFTYWKILHQTSGTALTDQIISWDQSAEETDRLLEVGQVLASSNLNIHS